MRTRRSAGARYAGAALLAAVLSGCQSTGTTGEGRTGSASSVSERPYGAVFLGTGECASAGPSGVTEVPCSGGRAAARVVARHDGRAGDGPPCPATTDFVLHISERRPAADEDGDGTVPGGYACMRNLRPPHPGDPGGGGGPHTVVGDCVRDTGGGTVHETPCSGTGDRAPEYRVAEAVTERSRCPAGTELYVRLGGARPVGCALPR